MRLILLLLPLHLPYPHPFSSMPGPRRRRGSSGGGGGGGEFSAHDVALAAAEIGQWGSGFGLRKSKGHKKARLGLSGPFFCCLLPEKNKKRRDMTSHK